MQLTCSELLDICRDNTLWRSKCFDKSSFLHNLRRRQLLLGRWSEFQADGPEAGRPARTPASTAVELAASRTKERKRIMANWDPSYPGENVNWYDEYIQRNAKAAVNWLQQPTLKDGPESTYIEARGLALYRPENPDQDPHKPETVFAVGPLEDGSVCLWDVTGCKGRKGAIHAKSRPGILYIDGFSRVGGTRSKRIDPSVVECISVDSKAHLAFFAVQSRTCVLFDKRRSARYD